MADLWLLTEAQMARLAPLLPDDTRGVPRAGDRRVISDIVHALRSGGRWAGAPPGYRPRKTLGNRFVRWAAKGVWERAFHALAEAGGPPAELLFDSSTMTQAIGFNRGGRTKLRALSDEHGRPPAFVLTGGQAADCRAAELLMDRLPPGVLVIADRGLTAMRCAPPSTHAGRR